MANKQNPMLAKIEEKYRREYEAKLRIARAEFNVMLKIALQQCADAALIAADDTFDVDEESAKRFNTAHIEHMNEISHMTVVDDKEDEEMVWTKATVDRRLLQIVGEKYFVPWDERYTV